MTKTVYIALVIVFACCFAGCDDSDKSLQQRIISGALLNELTDSQYMFPANATPDAETVYLPLRKWDIIFTGDISENADRIYETTANLLIPGTYNHIMVYVGKDSDGYAYAVELNVDDIQILDGKAAAIGDIRMLCLGTDYGELLHKSGQRVIDRNHYLSRWAMTFTDSVRNILIAADSNLTSRVIADLKTPVNYELEFEFSVARILNGDLSIRLVDDGAAGGSGCADYWIELFEQYAGLCFSGVRMRGDEIVSYFTESTEGRGAYLPAEFNPLGEEDVFIYQLIQFGFSVTEDDPHRCGDQSAESGLILPDLILQNELLKEIL